MEEKYIEMLNLLDQVNDPLVHRFLNIESEEGLDDKIEVLKALIAGKSPAEIPKYYSILEGLDSTQHWDL